MSRQIKIEVSPLITVHKYASSKFIDLRESVTVKRIPAVYSNPSKAGYFRPWRFTEAEKSGTSKLFYAKTTKFRIVLDVSQFPDNVKVNVVGNVIEVEGSHEMMKDKLGQISRSMKCKYKVPPDVKLDTLTSSLRTRGTLIINAERDLEDSLGKNFAEETSQYANQTSTTSRP